MQKLLLIVFLIAGINVVAQETTDTLPAKKYIQFSGVVVTGAELSPVPYTAVVEKKSRRGTYADYYGFFSFVASPGDTIIFSCVGYKKSYYFIPDTLSSSRYSLIHKITEDTILLKEKIIYPWPSKEQFKEAFLNVELPNDDLQRALVNLDPHILAIKEGAYENDGGINFKWQMYQRSTQLYYAGQAPPNNLLNPFAWAQFIRAWKNGDFKRKE